MRLRQRLLPTRHASQVWWTSSRQQQRQTDPEMTQSHRIWAGPSLESCTWKKIGASFERRGICFGWQRMDFIALSLPANHLGPAMGKTNEHKPSHWPTCPTVYRINVQNWLWSTEQAIHLLPAACQHMISAFLLKFVCNRWFWKVACSGDAWELKLLLFQAHICTLRLQMWISNRVVGKFYVFILQCSHKSKEKPIHYGWSKNIRLEF